MKILAAAAVLVSLGAGCTKETAPPAAPAATAKQEAQKPATETVSAKPNVPIPSPAPAIPVKPPQPAPGAEPDKIKVQHCLIGFQGSVPGKAITRTKEEAKALAYEVLEKARKGEDFDGLVKKYTDDSPPGIYGMTNVGKPQIGGYYARTGMVPAFGNVGFKLAVGEYGMADFDTATSKYGWHIIKRIE